MATNSVTVAYKGDATDLLAVNRKILEEYRAMQQQFQRQGTVQFSPQMTAPIKRAASEVEAIQRRTAENARTQQRIIENLTQRRVNAEIADERRLDRERKKSADQFIREMRRVEAEERKVNSTRSGGGIGSALGGFGSLLGGLGLSVGVASFVSAARSAVEISVDQVRQNRLLASSATEAGIAFSAAAEQNKAFADQLGLSERQAASTTARILQLAARAGRPQDAQKLQSGFADLSAAYGIDPNDLQTLIGTILSGQDEGLNRLGIADPGKLYEAYAKQIGTTSEKLTQMQKVQAAVNAVMEKSAQFTGAAAERMNSQEGSVAKTAAAWDKLKTSMSAAFASSPLVTNVINTLSSAFESLSTQIETVQKQVEAGKTPEQIAAEQRSGFLSKTSDFVTGALSLPGALSLYPADLIKDGFDTANRRFGSSVFGVGDRENQALADRIRSGLALTEKQKKAAEDSSKALADKIKLESQQTQTLEEQRKKAKEIQDDIDKAKDKAKSLGETYLSTWSSIVAQASGDNPIAKVYLEADAALEQLREKTLGLPDDIRSIFATMQVEANKLSLFKERLNSVFEAFDLREFAANVRNPEDPEKQRTEMARWRRSFLQDNPNYLFLKQQEFEARQRDTSDPISLGIKSFEDFINEDLKLRSSALFPNSAQAKLERALDLVRQQQPSNDREAAILDQRIISLGRSANPADLSQRQRDDIASAAERQATRVEAREQSAIAIYQAQLKVQQGILESNVELLKIAGSEGTKGLEKLLIEVKKDSADIGVQIDEPKPEDTRNNYDYLNFRGILPSG